MQQSRTAEIKAPTAPRPVTRMLHEFFSHRVVMHPGWSYVQYRLFVAMATTLPGPMEMSLVGDGAEALGGAAANANKLFHIFGKAEHNLGGFVAKFGSQEEAYKALLQATEAVVKQEGVTGVFEKTVQVAGETITVRGNVIDGVVHIGTAFK